MPTQSISLDTATNARIRNKVQELDEKWNMGNANTIWTNMMSGGGAPQKNVASGNSGSYPAAASRDYQTVSGVASPYVDVSTGGRQNKVRKQGFAKALRTYGRAVKPLGKNLKPVKEAMADYAVNALENPELLGGRQNKVRKQGVAKALRTYGRAVKPLGKNLKSVKKAAADAAVRELSGQSSMPYVEAYEVEAAPYFPSPPMKGGKRARKPSARNVIVKKVMAEKGLSLIEASKYVKAKGLY